MAPVDPRAYDEVAAEVGFEGRPNLGGGGQSVLRNQFREVASQIAETGGEEATRTAISVGEAEAAGAVVGMGLRGLALRGRTGTIWDAVRATQPVYEGTVIPRSFELATANTKVWVHGNATKHMAEYATSMLRRGVGQDLVNLASQEQIRSLQVAIEAAAAAPGGVTYGQLIRVGGWELRFAAPRAADQLPALTHALPQ
jgi:filamentous hemagglutinin